MNETLRMFGPVFDVPKYVTEDTKLTSGDQVTIPAGSIVNIHSMGVSLLHNY
jgi:cytochrome P450